MKSAPKLCPGCGRPVPPDAPANLCPGCLVAGGLSEEDPLKESNAASTSTLHIVIPDDAPMVSHPPQRLGSYQILEMIAHGGMGIVYKARHTGLDRVVAIKMIRSGVLASPRDVERFQREARSAAKLHHPNIVTIHDIGEQDGQHYFSMDYVPGENLAKRARAQPFSPRQAAEITARVASAIHYAHQQGVLHRDIKPANVILTPEQQPRVLDFGLAYVLADDSNLTLSGTPIGSPSYMPPEQAAGQTRRTDARSDVYSLGALLYELLTGRPPFQAASTLETLQLVIENEPVSPRRLNPALPRDLETICLKCLEKAPGRRYQTAQDLGDELGRFIRDEPILARPVLPVEKLWRWCRREPVVASLSATTLALLISVAIGSPIALYHIDQQRRNVEGARAEEASQRGVAQESARQAHRLLYAADMNLAQQSLKLNNLGKARRLLDRHVPQTGQEDLRGWEWRYLWQLTRSSALGTLANRPTRGWSVSFSPDGTRLAVGWYDGHVDLWDVPGRRLVRTLTDREYPPHGQVAFSPVRNLLAATSEPGVVTLYDLDSGGESILWRAPDLGEWDIKDLSFSQDGSRIVLYTGIPFQLAGSTPELADTVWVVNVSSARIEIRHATLPSGPPIYGAARLSPNSRHLFLARSEPSRSRYGIQCLDLAAKQELWQTEWQHDYGLTALAISPDGQVLVSGSGMVDPTIRVWDAGTGKRLRQLEGHTGSISDLTFTKDGRRLISAAGDQTIRFWDTSNWTETQVLRGHTDIVHAVAISESAKLIASASKDGNLMLWHADGTSAPEGYRRLAESLQLNEVLPLDRSRVLLLPPGQPPELVHLKRDSPALSLPEIGSSTNVLGCFDTNLLCHWNGTNQIIVRELRGAEFISRRAIAVNSGTRPAGVAYNPARQLLAWSEGTPSTSVYLASLAAPGDRIEMKSDVHGLVPLRFSEDGNYLVAANKRGDWNSLRAWNVETGLMVVSIRERGQGGAFGAGGRVLIVATELGKDHEIQFYDMFHPDRAPRRILGRSESQCLAVSPDGGLVASSTRGGQVRFFDPAKGALIDSVHGHSTAVFGIAFSADGRRLISSASGREAVKIWDVATRQELLTLGGAGSRLEAARWSADGDVILVGAPWQAWRAPSWEEIAEAEAKEKKETKQP